jgi:diadenosine tetraphosphate (Ap4A) HIT family hydrolase
MTELSPFEQAPSERWIASNDTTFTIRDAFPISPGHSLVLTKRRVGTWWEATHTERHDVMALVDIPKARLDAEFKPDGYNVGFNAGEAAGQTVAHFHLHFIPRFTGDVVDARSGAVRTGDAPGIVRSRETAFRTPPGQWRPRGVRECGR